VGIGAKVHLACGWVHHMPTLHERNAIWVGKTFHRKVSEGNITMVFRRYLLKHQNRILIQNDGGRGGKFHVEEERLDGKKMKKVEKSVPL